MLRLSSRAPGGVGKGGVLSFREPWGGKSATEVVTESQRFATATGIGVGLGEHNKQARGYGARREARAAEY